ncbi:actin-like ATPase domain-containing protein [Sistotremastrum niveocremeum HHB9708]|uniref:Actin-like ATPase domain-containing protein n=1 Tax=Sistotremastrum niveocremeum HHB9708 TaxID=1314777 RepID=A0A164RQ83_9AGAM|nr:actin-like ATPase domain-containing protein [Sistotremastrum niveocremeum HHB9708]
MPRGVPNTKKDDLSMRYTTFNVPAPLNPKTGGANYLKTETNSLWGRKPKRREAEPIEGKRGSNVIVIHPGSRYLRMGRASDIFPITVSHVIARKINGVVNPPPPIQRISRPTPSKKDGTDEDPIDDDDYPISLSPDDPLEAKIASISISLRERMRFYKLRISRDARKNATAFNKRSKPEIIHDHNDPYRVQWVTTPPAGDIVVGERVFRLVDPAKMGYSVRWPIYGTTLNTRQYPSIPELLGDLEAIWVTVLRDGLKIERSAYRNYSVVLVVPDFYDRGTLRELSHLLLVTMGFKQLCVQQESLSATFGAGISNACVIDMGAVKTSISCVDEGMVIPDTRLVLSMGGDDITEFLHVLLDRIHFPYRDLDLSKAYGWQVIEDLKARICTLLESDVAENMSDFFVRSPGNEAQKYAFRHYDETIMAPMCVFEPRVIEFERKSQGFRSVSHPSVEEVVDHQRDHVTQAMIISTQHLLPPSGPPPPLTFAFPQSTQPTPPPPSDQPAFAVAPQPAQVDSAEPQTGSFEGAPLVEANQSVTFVSVDPSDFGSKVSLGPEKEKEKEEELKPSTPIPPGADVVEPTPVAASVPESDPAIPIVPEEPVKAAPTPIDVDALSPIPTPRARTPLPLPPPPAHDPNVIYPGGFPIDVMFEASKLPLDVAIFNSARSAGGDDKIRKHLQAVMVVGGTSLIPGMAHALESRLQAIATPLVPNMEKVQIIPPPKDVDPRVLAWKGAAVLGKMDAVQDMWITPSDWDILGLRGLRERCLLG